MREYEIVNDFGDIIEKLKADMDVFRRERGSAFIASINEKFDDNRTKRVDSVYESVERFLKVGKLDHIEKWLGGRGYYVFVFNRDGFVSRAIIRIVEESVGADRDRLIGHVTSKPYSG